MQLCKVRWLNGEVRAGVVQDDHVRFLDLEDYAGIHALSDVLHADHPAVLAHDLIEDQGRGWPVNELMLLPPIDRQEVWAAGVTYKRSEEARKQESQGAARFYDLVYRAPRPELFFKATPNRVVGPGARVRIRSDAKWSVPEPELALVLSPHLKLVGYTIGNDMSSRDIEGENLLYLPQAKIYARSCAVGPWIVVDDTEDDARAWTIQLEIRRGEEQVFAGETRASQIKRSFTELVEYLFRSQQFPNGVVLLTGAGVIPPDAFTLAADDRVRITISGVGTLENSVAVV